MDHGQLSMVVDKFQWGFLKRGSMRVTKT